MATVALSKDDFASARSRISGRIHHTPLPSSRLLSQRIGAELFFKCENLQKTGSFKVRGVLNKLIQLDDDSRSNGVVTISAGNHAAALAWGAQEGEIQCTVVMPENASKLKAEASRGYGAEVVLHGTVFEAFEKAHELERERRLTFIHPFDDEQIIAGQGTVGVEILEQMEGVTVIVVPVGGGGLISGIATVVKLTNSSVRVYGVEPEGASAMRQSLDAGKAVHLDKVESVADGLAPPMAGEITYQYVKQYVDDVVTVTDDEIVAAMGLVLSRAKILTEPSGAASMAALLNGRIPINKTDRVVAVLSGGNVGMEKLTELGKTWKD